MRPILGFDSPQYNVPVYTSLGNHDWRLNPYPPFAFAGAPSSEELFDVKNPDVGRPEQLKEYLKYAHGQGHHLLLSYDKQVISKWQRALEAAKKLSKADDLVEAVKILYTVTKTAVTDSDKLLLKLLKGDPTIDIKKFPTATDIESVEWYLFCINPFLNYQFTLPGGYSLLMLDWEENENVVFDTSYKGRLYSLGFSTGAPRARNCLTALQKKLVEAFLKTNGKAKIVGMHSPPIGPWPDWYDDELLRGWNEFELGGRGTNFIPPLFVMAARPLKGIRSSLLIQRKAQKEPKTRCMEWMPLMAHLKMERNDVGILEIGSLSCWLIRNTTYA